METKVLFELGQELTDEFISRTDVAQHDPSWRMVAFEGYPTAMLMRPCDQDPGSLHYMLFPSAAAQRFHYHPGSRYLILLGDIDVRVEHSGAAVNDDPRTTARTIVLPAFSFNIVRIPAFHWHRFETNSAIRGKGVVAFSIHGDDGLDLCDVSDNLMHEVTVFFE